MELSNKFEEEIRQVIIKYGNVHLTYKHESVRTMEVLKEDTGTNLLFIESGSPYLTPTGRQKRTELVFFAPNKADWRIECKSREKPYGLLGEIKSELDYVANIPESRYCLILTDNLLTPYFLAELAQNVSEKGLKDKVWIGSKKRFKKMLKRQIK